MSSKKQTKPNNKIFNTLLLLVIALIIAYILYKLINLITVPNDSVIIEDGTITSEESVVRICNKR